MCCGFERVEYRDEGIGEEGRGGGPERVEMEEEQAEGGEMRVWGRRMMMGERVEVVEVDLNERVET